MAFGVLGRKVGMTQVFDETGRMFPVTVVSVPPCTVVQVKTAERDGYQAVQIGSEKVKASKLNRPERGHFERAGVEPHRILREFRVDDSASYEVGQSLGVDSFAEGQRVDVIGISKGKGFAGAIKRHGFHRGPMSHGSDYHRGPGSLGASASPSRVFKGKKLPGRMGSDRVTVRGLEVVRVDAERNLLLLKGAVPGARGGLVAVRKGKGRD